MQLHRLLTAAQAPSGVVPLAHLARFRSNGWHVGVAEKTSSGQEAAHELGYTVHELDGTGAGHADPGPEQLLVNCPLNPVLDTCAEMWKVSLAEEPANTDMSRYRRMALPTAPAPSTHLCLREPRPLARQWSPK